MTRRGTRKHTAQYERQNSDRRAHGSVSVGVDAWWSAELVIAMTGEQSALLTIERQGALPDGAPVGEQVSLVIYPGEMDAVVCLVEGIVAQARRNGVLRDATRQ